MADGKKNTGSLNIGYWNTGYWNTGSLNTGSLNIGYWNTGNRNTGNRNTGDRNTGDLNTGDLNTGDWNTGNWNTGDLNTGNRNTGYGNTGSLNTGYSNTGNRNTGDRNTGGWNTGDWNTGYLNTDQPTVRMFNKDTGLYHGGIEFPNYFYFNLTEWIYEADMTEQEKEDHKAEYKITGGYLKVYDWFECWRKAWDNATPEDRAKTFKLPNFDYEIFKEITGLDLKRDIVTETIKIGELEFDKSEVEKRLKDLKPIK